jgi:putative AlgH/UPF0301 family transcriptional regulator
MPDHEGDEGRPGRYRTRLRAAFQRFFIQDATLNIDEGICLTATVDILKAIAKVQAPSTRSGAGLCRLGARATGKRIQHNGWLHCDADADLIFGDNVDDKYARAFARSASMLACSRTRRGA